MSAGRILGIDHGLRRIGLAVSDSLRLTARELTIIERRSRAEDFAALLAILTDEQISAIVVGLPANYEGQPTQANIVRNWVQRLQRRTDLPVVLWDEQLSSTDARELAAMHKRPPDAPIDDLAARVILQSYLDALYTGLAEPPESHKRSES